MPPGLRWIDGRAAWLLAALWTGAGVVLWVVFPMISAGLLPLCLIAPLAWLWAAKGRMPHYPLSRVTALLLVVAVYLLLNATWSPSSSTAGMAVVSAFILVATLHVVLNALPDLEPPPLRAMAVGAVVGLGVAAGLQCLEVFSDQSVRRLLIRYIPALQPSVQHVATDGAQLALASYLPNANIAVLTLMAWPGALLVRGLGLGRRLGHVALLAAAVLAATVLASEHASSQVALIGAGVAFVLCRFGPKLALPLIAAGWVAANLLVVPAAWLLYSADAHRAPWLAESARHRVVIWRHTAAQIHKAPILGAGMGAARVLHGGQQAAAPLAPGTGFQLSTSLHSHNAYLQVWYEAGVVGAALMLGLGLTALWGLRAFAPAVQPYLAATFVSCALLMATAYSIWAPWFMASLAMTAIFAALGATLQPDRLFRPR